MGVAIQSMPDWPARMTAAVAALYMGVSKTTFLQRFGKLGVREGGNTLWSRAQLDRLVDAQFNLAPKLAAAPVGDYEQWKAARKGAA